MNVLQSILCAVGVAVLAGCSERSKPAETKPAAEKPKPSRSAPALSQEEPPEPSEPVYLEEARALMRTDAARAFDLLGRYKEAPAVERMLSLLVSKELVLPQDEKRRASRTSDQLRQRIVRKLSTWDEFRDLVKPGLLTFLKEFEASEPYAAISALKELNEWEVQGDGALYGKLLLASFGEPLSDNLGLAVALQKRVLEALPLLHSPELSGDLLRFLQHEQQLERRLGRRVSPVLQYLARFPDPDGLAVLTPYLHSSTYLYRPASMAIGAIGTPEALQALHERLNEYGWDRNHSRAFMAGLMRSTDPRARTVPRETLLGKSTASFARVDAAKAMAESLTPPEWMMIQSIDDQPHPMIRSYYLAAFARVAEHAEARSWMNQYAHTAAIANEHAVAHAVFQALGDARGIKQSASAKQERLQRLLDETPPYQLLGATRELATELYPDAEVRRLSHHATAGPTLWTFDQGVHLVVAAEGIRASGNKGQGPYKRIALSEKYPHAVLGMKVGDPPLVAWQQLGPLEPSNAYATLHFSLTVEGQPPMILQVRLSSRADCIKGFEVPDGSIAPRAVAS